MANNLLHTNAGDVAEWIEDEAEALEDEVEEMLDNVTERTHKAALEKVPVDTGELKESITKDGHSVFSDVEHAPHIGLGTIYTDGTDYLWGPAKKELIKALKQLAND